MHNYKLITISYNKANVNVGMVALDKLLNGENAILQKGDKIIWIRISKLLDDLKDWIKNNSEQDSCVFVTKIKVNVGTEYHKNICRPVYDAVKNTNISVILLLEYQDYLYDNATTAGLEMSV